MLMIGVTLSWNNLVSKIEIKSCVYKTIPVYKNKKYLTLKV